jgi:hypothetical protein
MLFQEIIPVYSETHIGPINNVQLPIENASGTCSHRRVLKG